MSENLRLYTKALYGFDHVVRLAGPDDWDNPSPCDGWTARHLVGHVNAIQRYLLATIDGEPPPMNPMEDPDRHAGDNPAATWADTRDTILAALDQPGVLRRRVQGFRGEEEVDEMIGFNVGDTTIHTWDLARALGVDDRLDPALVERCWQTLAPIADHLRGPGRMGPEVPVADDAPPQDRLIGLVGRDPS